jgi:hypothetical protein
MVKRPEMAERLIGLGMEPGACTAGVRAAINEESAKWAKIIKLARVP